MRPPDLAVVRQDGVDHSLPSRIVLIVTQISLSSSPVCGCGALPRPPRSRQGAGRRGRWDGLLADDPCERPDAHLSVTARQRAQIWWNFLSRQRFTGWRTLLLAASGAGGNHADTCGPRSRYPCFHAAVTKPIVPCRAHCGPMSRDWAGRDKPR